MKPKGCEKYGKIEVFLNILMLVGDIMLLVPFSSFSVF
jgi:hypothetical protein